MIPGLVGLAALAAYIVVLIGWRWYRYAGPELVVREGVVYETQPERSSLGDRLADAAADRFAAGVLARLGPHRVEAIRRRLESAGRPNGLTLEGYAGRRIVFTLLFSVLAAILFLSVSRFLAVVVFLFGWFFVDLGLRQEATKRQEDIDRDLPDFLDILAVSVRAGLSFRGGILRVCEAVPGPLADEMLTALRKMDLGESRRSAMLDLRDRNESEVLGRFVSSLLQAEELGTPLADTLTQIADEMRREAAALARQRAARAAPRVSLVVTLIIVPAALLLMVTGLLIGTEFDLGVFDA